jgi:hypothetical protein
MGRNRGKSIFKLILSILFLLTFVTFSFAVEKPKWVKDWEKFAASSS